MTERKEATLRIADLLHTMITVETPHSDLQTAVDKEGYEINTHKNLGNIFVSFTAKQGELHIKNNSRVTLLLTQDGLRYSPEEFSENKELKDFNGKLISIYIPEFKNRIDFSFLDPRKETATLTISLATRCTQTVTES